MRSGRTRAMFIRPCYRRKNGKRHAYWALVESYRTERGPRQRVVAYLSHLDESGRLGVQQAAEGTSHDAAQQRLFPSPEAAPRFVEIDTAAVRVENAREFGGPWLAWQLIGGWDWRNFCGRRWRPATKRCPGA